MWLDPIVDAFAVSFRILFMATLWIIILYFVYGHLRRNPVRPDFGHQIGSILAIWPKSGQNDRIPATGQNIPTRTAGFWSFCAGIQPFWRDSGQNCQLLVILCLILAVLV
jgi:hypothetical protein